MKRVRVSIHPELRDLESKKRNFAEVIVHRKDGRSISKRETQIRGRAPLLLDDSEVDAKFRGCTEPVLGEKNKPVAFGKAAQSRVPEGAENPASRSVRPGVVLEVNFFHRPKK